MLLKTSAFVTHLLVKCWTVCLHWYQEFCLSNTHFIDNNGKVNNNVLEISPQTPYLYVCYRATCIAYNCMLMYLFLSSDFGFSQSKDDV